MEYLVKLLSAFVLIFLLSCTSKEKAVNDSPTLVILPMAPMGSNQMVQDSIGRAPTYALEGKVLLQGEVPAPLSNVQVGLFRKQKNKWSEVARISTEPGGTFGFSRRLSAGSCEIRVLGQKYRGQLAVNLDKEPLSELILYATMADEGK
jgi:5-hydroxyisourate hydrolase-like protein (transthyretin family)